MTINSLLVVERMLSEVIKGEDPKKVMNTRLDIPSETNEQSSALNKFNTNKNGSTSRVEACFNSLGIKTFFDAYGELRFADIKENYLISPYSDQRLLEIYLIAENIPADSNLLDLFSSYEGSLEDLYKLVRDQVFLADEIR